MLLELLSNGSPYAAYEALRQGYVPSVGRSAGSAETQESQVGQQSGDFGPDYTLQLSPAAIARNSATQGGQGGESGTEDSSGQELSEEEEQEVEELKKRDKDVRAHEQAHLAAAGRYAKGGASFEYENGPDGKNYAVGGEVGIDTSKVDGDPQATLQKAEQVRRAALAPAEPSSQDRSVAAEATKMALEARQELAKAEGASSGMGGSGDAGLQSSRGDAAEDQDPGLPEVRVPSAYTDVPSAAGGRLSWVA